MNHQHDIAERLLKSALKKDPEEVAFGEVKVFEMAYFASKFFTSCPACGAEAWVDIDCRVCRIVSGIQYIAER